MILHAPDLIWECLGIWVCIVSKLKVHRPTNRVSSLRTQDQSTVFQAKPHLVMTQIPCPKLHVFGWCISMNFPNPEQICDLRAVLARKGG